MGKWRFKGVTTSSPIQEEKIMQGPKNQEAESLGAILEAAYHTALLFDSNKKRNKILEKYFMKFVV